MHIFRHIPETTTAKPVVVKPIPIKPKANDDAKIASNSKKAPYVNTSMLTKFDKITMLMLSIMQTNSMKQIINFRKTS